MKVFAWGVGGKGQLATGGEDGSNSEVLSKPVQCKLFHDAGKNERERQIASDPGDVSISAGYCHGVMAVNGKVFVTGCGADGRTGLGALESVSRWEEINLRPSIQVVAVSAGFRHTLILDRCGHIYSCGFGGDGALGHGNIEDVWTLRQIEKTLSIVSIKTISAGGLHSMAMTRDGEVYIWGCGKDGRLGFTNNEQRQDSAGNNTMCSELEPRRLELPFPSAQMVSAGHETSCVVDASSGRLYLFGCSKGGILGPNVDENICWPKPSTFLQDSRISYVDIGGQIAIAKTADGRLLGWGAAFSKLYNLKSRTLHVLRIPPNWGCVQAVSCGDSAAVGICKTQQGATKLWLFGLLCAAGIRAASPTDCDPANDIGYCCCVAAGFSHFYAADSLSECRLKNFPSVTKSKSYKNDLLPNDNNGFSADREAVKNRLDNPISYDLVQEKLMMAKSHEHSSTREGARILSNNSVKGGRYVRTDRCKGPAGEKRGVKGLHCNNDDKNEELRSNSWNKESPIEATGAIMSSEIVSVLTYQGLNKVSTIKKYRPQASKDEIIEFVKIFLRKNLQMMERRCLDTRDWTIYGISDIHTDIPKNMDYMKRMMASWKRNVYMPSALIVAGDIATSVDKIRESLTILKIGFDQVFYIPGNHDLWSPGDDNIDSIEKLVILIEMCTAIEIGISPCKLGSGNSAVAILPLFSWYRGDFIRGPGQPLTSQETYFDAACKWPSAVGDPNFPRNSHYPGIADFFLKLNDHTFQWLSEHSPLFSVSFSHFIPLPDLYQGTCNLQAVMGDLGLGHQVERTRSTVHLFGHSHLNMDRVIGKTRYIQNALGYPNSHWGNGTSVVQIWPTDNDNESRPS